MTELKRKRREEHKPPLPKWIVWLLIGLIAATSLGYWLAIRSSLKQAEPGMTFEEFRKTQQNQ
ncbi:MAG: hypothetical protein GX561_15455 [Lentisphaerae bacterium]|jgi:hypothetical protein|nr:hypothetical protein [Lentisphaerota bacterium]